MSTICCEKVDMLSTMRMASFFSAGELGVVGRKVDRKGDFGPIVGALLAAAALSHQRTRRHGEKRRESAGARERTMHANLVWK